MNKYFLEQEAYEQPTEIKANKRKGKIKYNGRNSLKVEITENCNVLITKKSVGGKEKIRMCLSDFLDTAAIISCINTEDEGKWYDEPRIYATEVK